MRTALIAGVCLLVMVSMPVSGQGPGSGTIGNYCSLIVPINGPDTMPIPPVEFVQSFGLITGVMVWYKEGDHGKWMVASVCTLLYEIVKCLLDLPQCVSTYANIVADAEMAMDYDADVTIFTRSGPVMSSPADVEIVPLVDYLDWYDDYVS